MARPRQLTETKRRTPRQARAAETVAAILEAAAQILEAGGLPALTTNAVAERAGVSIGTLYQYFSDKNALLTTLAQREVETALDQVARALKGETDPAPEARIRAVVRVIVNAFRGRLRARRAVVQAIMTQGTATGFMAPIAAFIAAEGARVGEAPHPVFARLSREQIFVLSRAMMGAIRSAVLEEQPFFTSRAFEDELVRLVMSYLESVTRSAAAER